MLRDMFVALQGVLGAVNPTTPTVPTTPAPVRATEAVKDFVVARDAHYAAESGNEQPPVDPEPVDPDPVDPGPGNEPNPPVPSPDPVHGKMSISVDADGGRVTLLELPKIGDGSVGVTAIRILDQPDTGHVSAIGQGGVALVMSEAAGFSGEIGFRYEMTMANGAVIEVDASVDVSASAHKAGWSLGDHYMLETGADNRVVVEHGDEHRKVYVTEGAHGLTRAEIARAEGMRASQVTDEWLLKNPEYGGSADKALDSSVGVSMWRTLTQSGDSQSSNWLLFERGYSYDKADADRLIYARVSGESELHPVFVGAYGEGNDPILRGGLSIYQRSSANVVIQDIDLFGGAQILKGENILFDHLSLGGKGGKGGNLQKVDGLTIRGTDVVDIARLTPENTGSQWHPSLNRVGGVFIAESERVLLEQNLFDHNGWAQGYDPNLSVRKPMPPSFYNHNLYMSDNSTDITIRDNIFMRGSSFGAQTRSGGTFEDNLFIDNNAAIHVAGGDKMRSGNFTLLLDNLVTSAGHKRVAQKEGALSMGINDVGVQSSLIGNIIAHLADPANAAEIAQKRVTHTALNDNDNRFYDDTLIYRWLGAPKLGAAVPVNGLPMSVLNEVTIQNFAAELLNKSTASIADLANFLRAQASGKIDQHVDADVINAFFREGFGLGTTLRADADTLVFIPDERAEGVRWDNRLNWSTGDLPGTQDGDSVDLNGNSVRYGTATQQIENLDFGDFGRLTVTAGKLTVAGEIAVGDRGAALAIDRAGQLWIDGYRDADLLTIDAAGGRFVNTGTVSGTVDIHFSDNAQGLVAVGGGRFDLVDGARLTVEGSQVRVGFDGADGGAALLRLHEGSETAFVADEGGFSALREFRSGAFGDAPAVSSGVALDGVLSLDLSDWTPARVRSVQTLISADEIVGQFDDVQVSGLDRDRDLLIRIDYDADQVLLILGADGAGSGRTSVSVVGEPLGSGADRALIDALGVPLVSAVDDPLAG